MNIDDIIENAQLKGRVIALEGQVQTLEAEVKCLEAVIRAHERVDCLSVTSLKKQLVEADAENARLKAECQARQAENSVLAVECDSLKAEVERLTGLLTQWKDIADAPTGHFIGYHKTKQGLIITGGIWVLEGKARFESGIGNEPTHWCEYPKYPEDIKS
jgi:cell division protein FtsB